MPQSAIDILPRNVPTVRTKKNQPLIPLFHTDIKKYFVSLQGVSKKRSDLVVHFLNRTHRVELEFGLLGLCSLCHPELYRSVVHDTRLHVHTLYLSFKKLLEKW